MTHPVNVVHLVQGLEIGGLEMMVVNLLKHLDRSRFHPAVCCYDSLGPLAAQLNERAITVDLLPRRPGVDLPYVFKLAGFLRQARPEILHLHNPTALFYGTLAGKLSGTPTIIYTEHGRDFSFSLKVKLANRILAKLATRVVTVAEFGKRFLTENEGIDPDKIVTIHNGIETSRFGRRYDIEYLRRELGLSKSRQVIGIVARLDPIKNHAGLITAMSRVATAAPDAVLLLIGDGPIRSELEAQVSTLGLCHHVRFLGARSDVPQLLNMLDLFVLCSHSEGLSLTLLEAAAASKPIVATDVGGNREVVEHCVNGLLVPPDQPEPLATAILDLLADPARAKRMGKAGYLMFQRNFTLNAMVTRYQDLYAACVPERFND